MEKDCKDWYKRQQKGGRRAVKKGKPKKQTGSGKQTGAGKKRKPRKRTEKKSKSRKQTGGCINPASCILYPVMRGGGRKSLFDLKGLMKKADKLPWARMVNWLDR